MTTVRLFLRRDALRHAEKDRLSQTYVAIDGQGAAARIAGCFSLATASVDREAAAVVPALQRLARLAVDRRVQGQGRGRYLFEEALGLTLELARTGPVAIRLFVTDAIDEGAARFCERFGFSRLGDRYPCRMMLDLEPRLR
jgi:GNAT superfamily N-acetyltransferase